MNLCDTFVAWYFGLYICILHGHIAEHITQNEVRLTVLLEYVSLLLGLMQSKIYKVGSFLSIFLLFTWPPTQLSCTMLLRAQECYKWLPLFSVPAELPALSISSSTHITTYIESFVHDNECNRNSMQQQ